MDTKLITIGDKKYVNPQYITSVYEDTNIRNETRWWVRLRDGQQLVVEAGYIEDLLRELT